MSHRAAFVRPTRLTLATLDKVVTEPRTRAVARAMMDETRVIAEAMGVPIRIDIERRIDGAVAVGGHRTVASAWRRVAGWEWSWDRFGRPLAPANHPLIACERSSATRWGLTFGP